VHYTNWSTLNFCISVHCSDAFEFEFFDSSRADPSWDILILELKPRRIFFMYSFFSSKYIFFFLLLPISETENREIFWKKHEFQFSSLHFFFELKGKGHKPSRVELKIVQLELWLEPAWLGLITGVQGNSKVHSQLRCLISGLLYYLIKVYNKIKSLSNMYEFSD